MANKSFSYTIDGETKTVGADSAAQVKRVYPKAQNIKLLEDYTKPKPKEKTSFTMHTDRDLFPSTTKPHPLFRRRGK